jgi:hypothetical protein
MTAFSLTLRSMAIVRPFLATFAAGSSTCVEYIVLMVLLSLKGCVSSPFKVLLSLRKVVRFQNFLRTLLPRRLSLVGADIQMRRVSQNPNTREPKKKFLDRGHTEPCLRGSHLLAFLGLFLFLNLLKVPFLWRQTTFLGRLLFFFLTSPSCFWRHTNPGGTRRLPRTCSCI